MLHLFARFDQHALDVGQAGQELLDVLELPLGAFPVLGEEGTEPRIPDRVELAHRVQTDRSTPDEIPDRIRRDQEVEALDDTPFRTRSQ
jgi:hypothetical protein